MKFIFVPVIAFAADGIIDAGIKIIYDARDQNQANAMKSVKGVADAMQEGPPPDPRDKPFSREYLEQIRSKNANLLKLNNDLAHFQNEVFKNDTQLLDQLPPNDPRRAEVEAHRKKVADDLSNTRKQQEFYRGKLGDANSAIDRWRAANDPNYTPPPKTTAASPAPGPEAEKPTGPETPSEPPNPDNPPGPDNSDGRDGGGSGNADNGLTSLKQKEAEQEAAARALGKQREAAVNKYLDDPNEANRREAEAMRHQLDGMVDDLNNIRDQVDQLQGTSRRHLRVRSARSIAQQRRRNGGMSSGGEMEHHHNPDGTDASGSGMEHHHNADGTDASGNYQQIGPGSGSGNPGTRQGGRRGRQSRAGRQRTGSNVASGESHHHVNGMDVPNQPGARQKRYRGAAASGMPNQQNTQFRNRQPQFQQQQQGRRRRQNPGY